MTPVTRVLRIWWRYDTRAVDRFGGLKIILWVGGESSEIRRSKRSLPFNLVIDKEERRHDPAIFFFSFSVGSDTYGFWRCKLVF